MGVLLKLWDGRVFIFYVPPHTVHENKKPPENVGEIKIEILLEKIIYFWLAHIQN